MTEERIDIEVTDKVSPEVGKKLLGIAKAAREANNSIVALKKQLASIDSSAIDKLSASTAKILAAQSRLISSQARVINANARMEASTIRNSIAQERLAQAQQKTALITAQTANANARAALAQTQNANAAATLATRQARATAATNAATVAQNLSGKVMQNNSRLSRQSLQQTQNLIYQLNDVVVSLASGQRPLTVLLQQGSQISTIFGPGKGVLGTLKAIGGALYDMFKPLAPGIAILAAVGVGFAGLTNEIKKTTGANVSFGNVVLATFQVLGKNLKETFSASFSSLAPIADSAYNILLKATKQVINSVIGGFVLVPRLIGIAFQRLPRILGEVFANTFVFILRTIKGGINQILDLINDLISEANKLAQKLGKDGDLIPNIPKIDIEIDQPGFKQFAVTLEEIKGAAKDSFKDYIPEITKQAIKNATEETKKLSKEAKEAAKHADALKKGLADIYAQAASDRASVGMDDFAKAIQTVDDKIANLVRDHGALNDEQKKTVENIKAIVTETVALEKLRDLYEETRTPVEEVNDELAKLEKLRPFAKSARDIDALNRKMDELKDSVNENAQVFKDFATDIYRAVGDSIEGVLDRSIKSFGDLADNFYQIFLKMIAKLATLALAKPIILPVVASVADGLGISGSVTKSIAKEFGVNDVSNLGNIASIGGTLTKPLLNGNIGLKGLEVLSGNLGLPLNTSANILNAFNPASIGAGIAGSFLGSKLFGNGGLPQTILSGAGGIAGTAAGGALLTASLGAAAGPVGAVLGSLAGSALGSLFGKKPSDKTAAGSIDLSQNRTFDLTGNSGKKYSKENTDFRDFIFSYASQLSDAITAETGNKIKTQLTARIGNRDGLRFSLGVGGAEQKFGDPNTYLTALTRQLIALGGTAANSSQKLQNISTAIGNIDFKNTEQALQDLNFAFNFDKIGEATKEISATEQALNDLKATFAQAADTAKRLGLNEQKVFDAREAAIKRLASSFNSSLRDDIVGNVLPSYKDFLELGKQYKQALADAKLIGGDTNLVQVRYQQQLNALLAQNQAVSTTLIEQEKERLDIAQDLAKRYGSVVNTFDDLLYKLQYGEFTANDPVTNLNSLRDLVTQTGISAKLGDVGAQEKLAQILPDFLKLSEEVNGANAQYGADLQLGNELAKATRDVAQRQLDIQTQIAASAAKQVELLQQMAQSGAGQIVQDQRFFTGNFSNESFSDTLANKVGQRAVAAGVISGEQFQAMVRAAGFYGIQGEGRSNKFFSENSNANAILLQAIRAAGYTGYASGGLITGGMAGRDSVPLIGMPGEWMLNRNAVNSIGHSNVAYMNATGRMPSNDNGEIVSAINAQTRVLAMMGDRLAELQERTANATENVASGITVGGWA